MSKSDQSKSALQTVIDIILKVGVLTLLVLWCFQMVKPFVNVIIWSVLIAVTVFPLYDTLQEKLNNRRKLAAILISLGLFLILVIPAFFLTDSMIEGIKEIRVGLGGKGVHIPPPSGDIKNVPLIGNWLHTTWQNASESLMPFFQKYKEQLVQAGQWLLNLLLGTGIGLLQLLISIVLSGILLSNVEKIAPLARSLFRKIAGDRGNEFLEITSHTIRNISKGVIGVAIIQSIILGIIFFASGIPYAGLWALFCLILAVIQVGPFLVTVPIIIYLFVHMSVAGAITWTILIFAASLLDNFLKPIFMGRGASVPMLVIFLGAIGGMIAGGFIGLFIGAVVISLGYKLFMTWLAE